ncbi:hypothetical protein BDV19DRAFT_370406 [Aspergillus venezuelensis]
MDRPLGVQALSGEFEEIHQHTFDPQTRLIMSFKGASAIVIDRNGGKVVGFNINDAMVIREIHPGQRIQIQEGIVKFDRPRY